MTTAFAHAARGQFVAAFHAQPAGLALAFGLFATSLVCLRALVTGNFPKVHAKPGPVVLLALGVVLFGWIYKFMTFPR